MAAKLTEVVNCLFKDRKNYRSLEKEDKELNFFIINRYLSKKFPEYAEKFNDKSIDKSLALDMWFLYLSDKVDWSVFKWFWSKTPKKTKFLSEKENKILLQRLMLKQEDLNILCQYYPDLVKEELKYYKELIKNEK